jgi:hypothetical protein
MDLFQIKSYGSSKIIPSDNKVMARNLSYQDFQKTSILQSQGSNKSEKLEMSNDYTLNPVNSKNNSVDYGNVHPKNQREVSAAQYSKVLLDRNVAFDPFLASANRFRTNRRQRLRQNESQETTQMPQIPKSKQTIYYPGQSSFMEGVREKKILFDDNSKKRKDRNLNRSQNTKLEYNDNSLYESPQYRSNNIQNAFQDHNRESIEQDRYFTRLEQSNRKQRAIFADHYKKFIIPSAKLINERKMIEHQRMMIAKQRMDQLEIERDHHLNNLKKNLYKSHLADTIRHKIQARKAQEEKKNAKDHIDYKQWMFETDQLQKKIDKKREQEELSNILTNQSMYKRMVPSAEPTIKPYSNRYQINQPNNMYTLGGFSLDKTQNDYDIDIQNHIQKSEQIYPKKVNQSFYESMQRSGQQFGERDGYIQNTII